ncbi:hypothetical protein [Phormidesmis sp. 146-33]
MKAIASKQLRVALPIISIVGVFLIFKTLLPIMLPAAASSPEAIKQHHAEVNRRCLQVSGLQNPRALGSIITFGDEIGYDALIVRGNYPQPHMNNQVGQSLCLFSRRTRQAYASDASSLSGS